MSIFLSRESEYALQSLLYIASLKGNKPVQQKEISQILQIPSPFLSKILQSLARNRILLSQKGKLGGFLLAKPAKEIYLYEVIKVIEGENFLEGCFLGFPGCSDHAPCPLHNSWKTLKGAMLEILKKSNLEDMSEHLGQKINKT